MRDLVNRVAIGAMIGAVLAVLLIPLYIVVAEAFIHPVLYP